MGRDEEDEAGDAATPAMETEARGPVAEPAEAPVAAAPEDPMDDLLGALDEVEARSAAVEERAVDAEEEQSAAEEVSPEAPSEAPALSHGDGMAEADVERVARRVVEMMSEQAVREVAWEVIPDLAEIVIKERIRELEAEAE
jgi:hypothetical protein